MGFSKKLDRELCSEFIIRGGFIVVDNTYHCPKCALSLREMGFNQINFKGHAPSTHRDCTSIFFKGNIKFEPKVLNSHNIVFAIQKKEVEPWDEYSNF